MRFSVSSSVVPVAFSKPVKTTLSARNCGVTLVAPILTSSNIAPQRSPGCSFFSQRSGNQVHTGERERTSWRGLKESTVYQKQAWCARAGAQEKIRQKQEAKNRRRQEIQCSFLELQVEMPSSDEKVVDGMRHGGHTSGYSRQSTRNEHHRSQQSYQQGQTRLNGDRLSSSGSTGVNHGQENEGAGVTGNRIQPTPLFQRIVTEEVQELKAYARMIENQSRRLVDLERTHKDLEHRLEIESRGRRQLEVTLEAREGDWSRKYEKLIKERDQWKAEKEKEEKKNKALLKHVSRKDQDIHRMLQRKYEHENVMTRSVQTLRQPPIERADRVAPNSGATTRSPEVRGSLQSPQDYLELFGMKEQARVRNVKSLLLDFFCV